MKRSAYLVGVSWFLLVSLAIADPGDHVTFTPLKPFNSKKDPKWGPVLTDIMNHEAPGDVNNFTGFITLAHETTHGINSYIRNKMNPGSQIINAFYVLNDRAVILNEPRMRKSAIAPLVPKILRGYRYQLYLQGQVEWDDRPLYIFDEWVAYVNGGEAGVDLVEKGLWTQPWQDGVFGSLEFSVYALATAMAVQEKDPKYFNEYLPFRDFLAWNLKRAMVSYYAGAKMKAFEWKTQDDYLDNLRKHPEAESLREFTRQLFGTSWTYEVFGF